MSALVLIIIYLLPTVIGFWRKHKSKLAIGFLNILLPFFLGGIDVLLAIEGGIVAGIFEKFILVPIFLVGSWIWPMAWSLTAAE